MKKYSSVTNARIVTPDKIIHGTIHFSNGTIIAIDETRIAGPSSYDANEQYVLPGLIETHGHFREPGFEHKEDIPHGTRAALAGGFTTVFDMPNTNPPITTVKLLHEQIERYKQRSYCDFAINFGASVSDIPELEKVNPSEIVGVKVFMAGHQTTPTTVTRKEDQAKIWEIAAGRGFPVLAHAEDQELVTKQEETLQKAGRTDMLAYSEARNEEVVIKAAQIAVELAIQYKTKLWILHASTSGEFDAVDRARKKGITASGEVTGYQLFFTTDDYEKLGTLIKVSPALRSPETNKKLWQMVRSGRIDGYCSEHTPHTLEEKNTDVWKAVSGTPGIQESIAVFITGWIREFGKETIEEGLHRLANMGSTNIANFFGFSQKSGITVGNDADFVIVEVDDPWHVAKKDLFTKLNWSVYEGMDLIGRPRATFLRGKLVYENGKILTNERGKWLEHHNR
ncbi:dihydroorotase family protein [Candidatus Roizmanbacteria bacterium]|nr:dihydroorotase family protein [Candidatus Roizmanbacteria bacterium]